MIQIIATSLLVLILLTGGLFSSLPIYASTEDSGSSGDTGEGGEDTGSEPESDPEPETEPEPEVEPEPEPESPPEGPVCLSLDCPPAPPVEEPEPKPELPICDGTPQDCITNDGNVCLEGQGGHECECSEDMSDCPMHPSLLVPDNDCLFHPELPKCASDNGVCPDGFFQNEDGNCVPSHPNGCPEGFHSHEDDETGRCIPNDVPCEPGYVIDPDFPTCSKKVDVCKKHPNADVCKDGNDHDKKIIFIKKIIKDTKIINKINSVSGDTDIEQTIVAINYDEGQGINCVFGDDNDGQCETFDVNVDKGKEPLLQIIPFT